MRREIPELWTDPIETFLGKRETPLGRRLEVFERELYIEIAEAVLFMEKHEIAKVEKANIVTKEQSEKVYISYQISLTKIHSNTLPKEVNL
ncbi:MAG: hypothetical protein LBR92_03925 [Puniceicoccales bacterium]|jgi:hypothetical protein|nr:hypothetical protein [Puniceicoccales bacterium]